MTIPDYLENWPTVVEFGGAIGRTASAACKQGQHDLCTDEACRCRHHGRVAGDVVAQPGVAGETYPCQHCPSEVRFVNGWRHTDDGSMIRRVERDSGWVDHHHATPDYGPSDT